MNKILEQVKEYHQARKLVSDFDNTPKQGLADKGRLIMKKINTWFNYLIELEVKDNE